MKNDVLVIGDVGLDTFLSIDEDEARLIHNIRQHHCEICFDYAEKIPVKASHEAVGGNAANAAVSLARLKIKTALYTIIGQDQSGRKILQTLRQEKINLPYISQSARSNHATIITYEGERTIFSYHEPHPYHLPRLTPFSWFYVTSLRDNFSPIFRHLLVHLKRQPASLVYNPGTYQLRAGIAASQSLLHKTTVLILNKEEAAGWLKLPPTTAAIELLSELSLYGPRCVVITDAEKGSYGFDGINFYHCPAYLVKKAEATGAGDAYASALTAALFYGASLKEAMRWGALNSAAVVQKIGAQTGLLRLAELKKSLNQSMDSVIPVPLVN